MSVVSMTKGCYKNYYAFRAYGKTSACKWHNSYRARGPLVTRLKGPHPAFCSSTFHVRRLRKIQYFVTRKLFDQRGYIIMQFSRRTPVRDASLLLYKLRQEDRIRKKRKQRGQDKARKTRKKRRRKTWETLAEGRSLRYRHPGSLTSAVGDCTTCFQEPGPT